MSRDWYIDAFGHPIADIRAKLIDEGWFGRRTNEPSHDLGWMRDAQDKPEPTHQPSRDPDHGIDR